MSESATNGNGAADGCKKLKPKRAVQRRGRPRPGWQKRFIAALRELPNATEACKTVGISIPGAYAARAKQPKFAKEWLEALDVGGQRMEGVMMRDARYGTDDWTWMKDRQGRIVKKPLPRKVDTTARIFLLKGLMPYKYRELVHAEISGPQGGPIDLSMGITIQWPHEAAKLNGNGHEPKQIQATVTDAEPEAGDDNAAAAAPGAD